MSRSAGRDEPPVDPWPCVPDAAASDHVLKRHVPQPEGGRIEHVVEATAAGQAASRFAEIHDALVSCVEVRRGVRCRLPTRRDLVGHGRGRRRAAGPVLGAPTRAAAGRRSTPDRQCEHRPQRQCGHDRRAGWLRAGRQRPGHSEDAQAAVTRLCPVTGGACVTDPDQQRTYPEPAADLPGWLTVTDVTGATGDDRISAAGEVLAAPPGPSPSSASRPTRAAPGRRRWRAARSTTLRSAAIGVDEYIARFPSGGCGARLLRHAHGRGRLLSGRAFARRAEHRRVTGNGGVAGTTWRSTVAETDSVFVYGWS